MLKFETPKALGWPRRFVVLMGGSRVGSTWLMDLLNAHPNIHAAAEIIDFVLRPRELDVETRKRRLRETLYDFYNPSKALNTGAIGFKVRMRPSYWKEPTLDDFREALYENSVTHAILLLRENKIKQTVSHFRSLQLAGRTGSHNTRDQETLRGLPSCHIPPKHFMRSLRNIEIERENLFRFSASLGLPLMRLSYEDLCEDTSKSLKRICQLLSLPYEEAFFKTQSFLKIMPEFVCEAVGNTRELSAACAGTSYEAIAKETFAEKPPRKTPRTKRRTEGKEEDTVPNDVKISLICPVYDPNPEHLNKMIESVLRQSYRNWEMQIIDGGSRKEQIKKILEKHAKQDARLKILTLPENLGISANTNKGIQAACGEWVGFVDHDDQLEMDALQQFVREIKANPDTDIFYCDEDKLNEFGDFFESHQKPEWSPELLLSCNYLGHMVLIRRSVLSETGFLRPEFDGAQDYDLWLRAAEKTNRIRRIPRVLYHWRCTPHSASVSKYAKPYAARRAAKAIEESLSRTGRAGARVLQDAGAFYHARYPLRSRPLVSIIIPTRDRSDLLEQCLNGLMNKTGYKNFEIIIADNDSRKKETFAYFKKIKNSQRVRVIHAPGDFNFSRINNQAAKTAKGEYLLFLNNDTEPVAEDWLEALLEQAECGEVGAVGAKLLYPDGRIQHAGVVVNGRAVGHAHQFMLNADTGYFSRAHMIHNVTAVTAACMLVRREDFMNAGGFDEKLAVAYNDVDLCLKLRRIGLRNVYTPHAVLLHHESASRGRADRFSKRFAKETEYLQKKWGDLIEKDAFYPADICSNPPYEGTLTPKYEKTLKQRIINKVKVFFARFFWARDFDPKTYLHNYLDLQKAGIDTSGALLEHWVLYGRYEMRHYRFKIR